MSQDSESGCSLIRIAFRMCGAVAFLCLVVFVTNTSGQQKPTATGALGAAGVLHSASNGITTSDLARRNPRYELCASDVLAISFPLTPEFNQTVTVQPDGFATLTAVGDVHFEGLTTEQSVEAIRAAYAKVLHDPIVTVELKKFNEPYFIVSGQVHRPGKYDLRGYTTATQAVAMAGGFNENAKHSQVLLFRRVNNDWFEVKDLNLKRILQGRDVAEDPQIHSGDMLFVPTVSGLQERDPASVPEVYTKSYRLIFYLAIPAFTLVVIVSPFVSSIWLGTYNPLFVEFVALLAGGWLVNVLSNPAYVIDLGTGTLRWVSIGCVLTAILNAALGFAAGKLFGATGIVVAAACSLALGYVLILAAYHIEHRVSFRALIPPHSAGTVTASIAAAIVFIPLFQVRGASPLFSPRVALATGGVLLIMIIPMWMHPMRRRVWNWITSRATV